MLDDALNHVVVVLTASEGGRCIQIIDPFYHQKLKII